MILAGDIGGTSTRLALFKVEDGRLRLATEKIYPSQKYGGLEEIAVAFVKSTGHSIRRACFGIAGPVRDGRVTTPNLAWVVDAESLTRCLSVAQVKLLNDLEANAYGLSVLGAEDLVTLNPGAPGANGNRAVISVGTGLGEAGLFWDGKAHLPFACEGGHADFAPKTELEVELLRYLLGKMDHVSFERVLSGPGLHLIYQFLRDTGRGQEKASVAAEMAQGDASAVVSKNGLDDRCELCARSLDLFVSFYGAEAGNLALKTMATGGVYIGGGIAPKILKRLQGPLFMQAFTAKGRMRPLLEAMPVHVVMKETAALLGAARVAADVGN